MSELQELRVLQEDMGCDAVTLEDAGEGITYLFVSPNQSFDSAIKSVMKACPTLTRGQVQDLIRDHCPDIKEMNERLGIDHPPVPRFEAAPAPDVLPPVDEKGAHRRPRPPRWARIAAIAAPALVGGALLAQVFSPAGRGGDTGRSGAHEKTVSQGDAPSVFDDPTFKRYVNGGKIHCDSVGQYAAKCVDDDGQVMLSEASVGDTAVFTFSYGSDNIAFRIFENTADAKLWAAEDANRKLYDNLTVVGRVVLWGTDQDRLRAWSHALTEQRANKASAMGGASPIGAASPIDALPQRLAVLAFGTLGVTERTADGAVTPASIREAQTLRGVALVMGINHSDIDGTAPSGPYDAVAVAADAPRPPRWTTGGDLSPHGGESSTPVQPPVVVAAPTSTTAPPAQPTTPPPAQPTTEQPAAPAPDDSTTKPAPPPETSQPTPAQPPAEQQPTQTPGQPAETVPAEPQPEPAGEETQPPAPEQPTTDPQPKPADDTPAEPSTPPAAEPAPEQTPTDHQGDDQDADGDQDQAAETTPAPPVEEEPEDGLSMAALPVAWAA
ncbi:hypothetical protein HCJ76_44230 [Streptomyces sp. MC1]|uniref:hypothetical protein n=1 Tax=Streptomyces sp. MC1 TaxID=295105 RepID=UPI0018C9D74F|nr:hypothetical protein [Streptomyces sp. MC1]MBG7704893.1 hypothetical protein [Streptomyces sp. MC1]